MRASRSGVEADLPGVDGALEDHVGFLPFSFGQRRVCSTSITRSARVAGLTKASRSTGAALPLRRHAEDHALLGQPLSTTARTSWSSQPGRSNSTTDSSGSHTRRR